MALNGGDLPVLVARQPFRKFCRQRAGAAGERYTSGAALLLSLAKQHECRYGRHSEPPFQKRCLSCLGQVVHPAHTR